MRSTIPTDTKRTYVLIGGLDMAGLAVVGAGVLSGLGVLHLHHLSVPVKITLALLAFGMGAALGWGKWPMTDSGDRLGVWILRFVHYFLEEFTDRPYLHPHSLKSRRPRSHE